MIQSSIALSCSACYFLDGGAASHHQVLGQLSITCHSHFVHNESSPSFTEANPIQTHLLHLSPPYFLKETSYYYPRPATHQLVCLSNGSLYFFHYWRACEWDKSCLRDQLRSPALFHAGLLWLDSSRGHKSLCEAGQSAGSNPFFV